MITADQLKDVMDRADALHHYLNIDQKKVEFEEEQPAPKIKAQPAKAPEPSSFQPPCEQQSAIWKAVAFIGALAIVFSALITGAWE